MHDPRPDTLPLGLLPVTGEKTLDFLQGYLTCDCQTINPAELTPWALCNLQGRVVANGWAVHLDDSSVGLIMDRSLLSRVADMLTPYARFHRCELNIAQAQKIAVTSEPASPDAQGWPVHGCYLSLDIESDPEASHTLAEQLIVTRFPLLSDAVSERFLPQVLNLVEQGAVDFDKGCYLGQEIVARAQFRGAVKKQLQSFSWHHTPPVIGAAYEVPQSIPASGESAPDLTRFEAIINSVSSQIETDSTFSGVALGVTRS